MTTGCTKTYIDSLITSKERTVLAGWYFASRCNIDTSKKQYGIEDIEKERVGKEDFQAMQKSLDNDYPGTYYLIVYINKDRIYNTVYDGSKFDKNNYDNRIIIRIICKLDDNKKPVDYFGFFGEEEKLTKVLNTRKDNKRIKYEKSDKYKV